MGIVKEFDCGPWAGNQNDLKYAGTDLILFLQKQGSGIAQVGCLIFLELIVLLSKKLCQLCKSGLTSVCSFTNKMALRSPLRQWLQYLFSFQTLVYRMHISRLLPHFSYSGTRTVLPRNFSFSFTQTAIKRRLGIFLIFLESIYAVGLFAGLLYRSGELQLLSRSPV